MFTILRNHSTRLAAPFNLNGFGKFRRLRLSANILVFLFSFSALILSADAQSTDDPAALLPIVVTAPTATKTVPSTFVVPITVDDITGVGIFAFQFNILYNPAVIDPSGTNFGCSTAGTIAGTAGLSATCNVLPDGTLRVSAFGAGTMTGSGTILNVTFTTDAGAAPGNVSPLTFQDVFFFNGAGSVANSPVNGQITLVGTPVVTAPTASKGVPSTFVVPITISDISGLGIFAFQFDILYGPAVIDPSGPNSGCSTAGTIAGTAGLAATCNVSPDGTLRVAVSGVSPMTGSGTILNITFTTDPSAAPGNISPLTFQNAAFFNNIGPVAVSTVNGQITLVGPTAALVSVGGIVTAADGSPIRFARLSLTDQSGFSRGALSNDFGYYRFDDVPVGEAYVISARAKNYLFAPRLVNVADEIRNLNMAAEP